jgi:hypothetical protein
MRHSALAAPQPATTLDVVARAVITASLAAIDALPGSRRTAAQLDAVARARAQLARMRASPVALARPVVVFNGYRGWWGLASTVRDALREATGSDDIIFVSYAHRGTFAQACDDARRTIARYLGPAAARGEVPFDAVGISMGGLVARVLTTRGASDADERVLREARGSDSTVRIATLHTLSTPHRPGSPLVRALHRAHEASMGPALHCFGQTRDAIVGVSNTAPKGVTPVRMPGPAFGSHFTSARNPVFWAHIATSLRTDTSREHGTSAP